MRRRAFIASPLTLLLAGAAGAARYPAVLPGIALAFPRDHGAHPAFRVEWWYVTGWVRDGTGSDYGFQVTFFRNRPGVAEENPSAFAPRELVFAHAALADPGRGALLHDQRAARAGFGLAGAGEETTRAWVGDWSFELAGDAYAARVSAREFEFDLRFAATQPILLQGQDGFSRKGPDPLQSSYYYSRPQLAVSGSISLAGKARAVSGSAWLDHEWSSAVMAPEAVGWDWTGINLADGAALMAFRMRDGDGRALWAGGSLRGADGRVERFGPGDVRFTPQRRWRSPRTQIEYPVAMVVGVAGRQYTLLPLFDDQELDSRASTGTIYWEGAVRALDGEREAGRGYLELTGYGEPLRL